MKTSARNTRNRRPLFISTAARAILLAVVWGLSATVPAHAKPGPDDCEGISFGPEIISTDIDGAWSVFAADIDGDGDNDVLARVASFEDTKIVWYENTDGFGTFGPPQIITTNAYEIHSIFAADLDGDGDTDVLSASRYDDHIAWYENTDGVGTFGPQQVITTDADGATSVFAADIDGDGDIDVLSASGNDDTIAWYENTDGLGNFGAQQVITTDAEEANSVFAADLDGDGDIDVLSASAGESFEKPSKVAWYENTDGAGNFGPQQVITSDVRDARAVFAADLDGDGDLDVLSAAYGNTNVASPAKYEGKIEWYENTDGRGTFAPPYVIASDLHGIPDVHPADLDGDGDIDLLSAPYYGSEIMWYENADGKGSFDAMNIVATYVNGTKSVFGADLNGDGSVDVLSASSYDNTVAWYENQTDCNDNGTNDGCDIADGTSLDCNNNGRPDECEIADETSEDCDADGLLDQCEPDCNHNRHPDDCDLAGGTSADCNSNGVPDECDISDDTSGDCNDNRVPDECDIADGTSTDCDGDGVPSECEADCNNNGQPDDCDIANGTSADCNFTGVPDICELGRGFAPHPITTGASKAKSVFAIDLDGDGDTDVLSASFGGDRIAWYENIDGRGTLSRRHTITNTARGAMSVYAIDLDGDGDVDVLSASEKDDKIAWYENTDGLGAFGPQQIISTAADGARSVFAADLDGDGDIDVLSASYGDDKIAWYENTDGVGTFGPQQIITPELARATSVFAADLDGDGDTDVISASTGDTSVAWYENTDGLGTFGPPQAINATGHAVSLYATDVDGDGDTDVLSAGGGVHWYENTDGLGSFGQQRTINTASSGSVFASDLDGDGDIDVVSVSSRGDRLAWYDNTDGLGAFGPQQLLTTDTGPTHLNFAQSVFAADVDGDGDRDVLWASERDGKIAWYENSGFIPDCNYNQVPDECDINGGASTDCNSNRVPDDCELEREFPPQVIAQASDRAKPIFCADLDGDGDTDVLSASATFQGAVTWHRNTDGLGTFAPRLAIATNIGGVLSVFAADLDGDGDTDVLSGSLFDIVWIENIDGLGTFGTKRMVTTTVGYNGVFIFAVDLDGDGDIDILSSSRSNTMLAWYENTDGLGTFSRRRIINTLFGGSSVFAADLDGDGDIDVLSGPSWFENTDGRGDFGPRLAIHTTANSVKSVFAADVDGDGDNDVVSASGWYENTDGLGTFGPLQVIGLPDDLVSTIIVADMDGDGDGDVLSASFYADKIAWYENTDGLGTFGPQQIIGIADGPWAIFSADLDGDGDLDILSSSEFDDKIRWHENTGYSRDCNDNNMPDVCDIADGISGDCNGSDIPDECEPFGIEDVDGDGVVELCDLCPDSHMDRTLIVNGCDTGVAEFVFDSGCTMADLLDECNGDGRTHGDYVSCVTDVANEWIRESVITGREFGRVVSCAAKPQTTIRRALRNDDGGRK